MRQGKPKAPPSTKKFARCLDNARALLRDAADVWALGDPEEPPTLDVLLTILQAFAKEGFLFFPTEAGINTAVPHRGVSEAKSAG